MSTKSPLAEDIENDRRMNGSLFTPYLHCSRQGDLPDDLWDFKLAVPVEPWRYVGWCPSAATSKPDSGWPGLDYHVAVMLENPKEEQVWLHVPVTDEMLDAAPLHRFRP